MKRLRHPVLKSIDRSLAFGGTFSNVKISCVTLPYPSVRQKAIVKVKGYACHVGIDNA